MSDKIEYYASNTGLLFKFNITKQIAYRYIKENNSWDEGNNYHKEYYSYPPQYCPEYESYPIMHQQYCQDKTGIFYFLSLYKHCYKCNWTKLNKDNYKLWLI
jgi:hypothetical protein